MIFLSSCSLLSSNIKDGKEVKYVKDPFNPNRMVTEAEAKKTGKLDLFGLGRKDDKPEGYQEKNYFLWSACVDVLSELPPKISDATGGIYITDYVPTNNGLLQAIQCRVTGKKVLSSNVNVSVFTKKLDGSDLTQSENNALKSNILIRARELKAQYDASL